MTGKPLSSAGSKGVWIRNLSATDATARPRSRVRPRRGDRAYHWFARLSLSIACLLPMGASAQPAYPSQPVRVMVGASAGGGSDLLARILAERWSQTLGQPVIVENRPGAANTLASAAVARAAPDGYTLLLATNTGQSIAPLLLKLPFDPLKDLQPIGMAMVVPHLLLVGPRQKAASAAELIARIKARPGDYNYASAGIGSTQHVAGEVLSQAAGVKMSHVPYKGSSAAFPDLISGQVQLIVDTTSSALPQVQAGTLRALAITTATRSPLFPDVPTMREIGYPSVDITTWYGIYAPAGTPASILDRLHQELQAALDDPATRARLEAMGGEIPAMTRRQFTDMNHAEAKRYRALLNAAGIRPE